MRELNTVRAAVHEVYASYVRAKEQVVGKLDREVRHPEWTRRLLDVMGAPDRRGYNVAVTGSKGKGSHSILMACILQRLGFSVGLFTGPDLVDFMERFRVNGQVMPEPDFLRLATVALQHTEAFNLPDKQYIGPVGILAAVGCAWFAECGTDVNIIECGRGALHDDVNQVCHQGAVLAPIFLEHARQLGPTLADIAREKAGVITADTRFVVSQPQASVVRAAIEDRLVGVDVGAWLELQRDFDYSTEKADGLVAVTVGGVRLLLPGAYAPMAANAAVALQASLQVVMALRGSLAAVPPVISLADLQLPGRLHVVRQRPITVVDGTIHATSARMVVEWLHSVSRPGVRVGAVLGLPADKDGAGVLETLAPSLDWCVLSRTHKPHLEFTDDWYALAQAQGMNVSTAPDIETAAQMADSRLSDDDILLVLGTQSFVGDALTYFHADSRSVWANPT